MGLGIITECQVLNSGALKDPFLSCTMKNEAKKIRKMRRKKPRPVEKTETEKKEQKETRFSWSTMEGGGGKKQESSF